MDSDVTQNLTLKFLAFHAVVTPDVKTGLSFLHTSCSNGDLETLSIILTCSPSNLDTLIAMSIKTCCHDDEPKLPEELITKSQDSLRRQQMLHIIETAAGLSQPKSMIHAVAKKGHVYQMAILLKLGQRINCISKDPADKSATPLILASAYNTSEMVEYLLSRGANSDMTDSQFNMAIHSASVCGNARSIMALIAIGSDVNVKGFRGKAPLHFAALNGKMEATKVLCENGAEVNARTAFGDTPLTCAAQNGDYENMKLLLEKGANVHDRNSIGYNALFYATKKGFTDIAKLLLSSGCDVNARARIRDTPLTIASGIQGNKLMVEFLLRSGADINMADRQGRQALHHAGDAEITDSLLDAGAVIESRDLYGLTPLLFAFSSENRHSSMEVATKLIQRGACVNAKEVLSLYSPLHHLCAHHDVDRNIVKLLLDKGADVNSLDSEGETPLFSAVRNADVEIVELLLKHGASADIKNDSSLTPFDVCSSAEGVHGGALVLEVLKKHKDKV